MEFLWFAGSAYAGVLSGILSAIVLAGAKRGDKSFWKVWILVVLFALNVFFHVWYWQWPSFGLDFLKGS
tara:strand:- start:159 stop:365 length:207 start_codon:yes stop_codon:yes gene_type:complete